MEMHNERRLQLKQQQQEDLQKHVHVGWPRFQNQVLEVGILEVSEIGNRKVVLENERLRRMQISMEEHMEILKQVKLSNDKLLKRAEEREKTRQRELEEEDEMWQKFRDTLLQAKLMAEERKEKKAEERKEKNEEMLLQQKLSAEKKMQEEALDKELLKQYYLQQEEQKKHQVHQSSKKIKMH